MQFMPHPRNVRKKKIPGYLEPISVPCLYTASCMASIESFQSIGLSCGWDAESSMLVGADELAEKNGATNQ